MKFDIRFVKKMVGRFTFFKLLVVASVLVGIVLIFLLSEILVPVSTAMPSTDYPSIDVECKGKWNDIAITQDQLDELLEQHRIFLSRAILPELGIKSPYTDIKASPPDTTRNLSGFATSIPNSTVGS